jgi:hypothetical protein
LFWRNKDAINQFIEKDIQIDRGLQAVLANGHEVKSIVNYPYHYSLSFSKVMFNSLDSNDDLVRNVFNDLTSNKNVLEARRAIYSTKRYYNDDNDSNLDLSAITNADDINIDIVNSLRNIETNSIANKGTIIKLNYDDFRDYVRGMYIAIPSIFEGKLLQKLNITPYSESVKVKASDDMIIDRNVNRRLMVSPFPYIQDHYIESL